MERLRDFFVERLHDFLCGEVACFFVVESLHDFLCEEVGCMIFVWRGCVIFLNHLLRLHDFFVEVTRFFCGEVAFFFCEEVGCFFCEEVA